MTTACAGRDRSDSSVIAACLILLITMIVYGTSHQASVYASDLDVPAYMIYVDPVTGKYTTKPPAEQGEVVNNTGNTGPSGTPINTITGQTDSAVSTNSPPNLRAPVTAVLLLVGLGVISLLFKGRQIS